MDDTRAVDLTRRSLAKSAALLVAMASMGRAGTLLAETESPRRPLAPLPDWPWADPASLVSTIAAGTVAVPNVAEVVDAYRRGLGYTEHWHGQITAGMADFWGVPAMAGRAASVTGPAGLDNGLIRLVELGDDFQPIPSYPTLGWTALEIRVRNVDDMPAQLSGLPFVHTGGPRDLQFGSGPPTLRPAQFLGPAGEPLYFTEDLQVDRGKLIGGNNVGGIFLQTLTAVPYPETRDFYLKTLAMQLRAQVGFPRPNVAAIPGADATRMYKMASVRAPWYCAIQVDEYPDATQKRPAVPGCFPPGICMCTLQVPDLDAVAEALRGIELPFTRTDANAMPPWAGGRAIACRGYSGEIVEFIEPGA